ncbi:MAG: PKD domain-containing protein [Candidatus Thiodiazotropha sp. (ex Monitilora ramsayi)]|nr:PKD domain-containing protein [Candidatus Thiodiazotropha sp. (ex Monitilora ramsayi)]
MKNQLSLKFRLVFLLLMLSLFGWTSQAAAACQTNCLSLWSLKLTDLGTSISASAKFVDEFGSSGASRLATVQGRWTRPDGSTVLQSARIGTRLRADFKLVTGGVSGDYSFEVLDVTRTGYTYDAAAGVDPLAAITIAGSTNQVPVAVLNSDVTSGDAPLTVNFNGSGSFDPDGEPIHYLWSFGDGSTSSTANPSHAYQVSGDFTATLTVVDDLGASSRSSIVIKVNEPTVTTVTTACQYQCASVKKYKLEYKSDKNLIRGFVWLQDENGNILYDATVDATWTLPDGSTVAQTKANGSRKRVVFKMPANAYGTYTLTVIDVSKSGYTYDADSNSADSGSFKHTF